MTGTLLNGILWHLRDRPDVRPGLVSRLAFERLDANHDGVVTFAEYRRAQTAAKR